MDGVSRGTPALPAVSHTQVENDSRAEGRRATEINAAQRQARNQREIHDHLDGMFQKYRKPTTLPPGASAQDHAKVAEHNTKIDALVSSRAELLASEGEDLDSVRRTLENAHSLDSKSTSGSSLVAGLPFALVAIAQHLKPNLVEAPAKMLTSLAGTTSPYAEAAAQGLVAALEAVALDQISTAAQNEMNKDLLFFKAPEDNLHDVMVEALKDKEPGRLTQAGTGAAEMQTFSVRNVLRNGLDTHLSSQANQPGLRPEAQAAATTKAANAGTTITSVGGVFSTMGSAHLARMREEKSGLRDPAQIFARKDAEPKENLADERDWYDIYKAAKDTSWKAMASHGASRVGNAAMGTLSSTLDGVRSLGTARSVLANGGFAATFSGVSAIQKAATAPISNPLAKAAVNNAINLVGSATAFGVYGAMNAVGQKVADKASEWYDKDNHAAPKAAARQAMESTRDGTKHAFEATRNGTSHAIEATRNGANQALESTRNGINSALATGRQTLDTAAAMVGSIDSDAITRQLMGQVNELRQRQRQQPNEEDGIEMV
ncbi:hypothetical protein [Pseudomonas sp. PA27(2017)]|uniref:hypothetical protein n=1 Tax=Pseudomonas sp. PA27(2017) TaxID=1932112 RepID=UPI00095A1C51|nr:hypothetical protein [Pseudomonas sp. PA27(2017)]OLU35604.1 hypothetical protein BVH06_02100 [Pseudomonas sp. PA27(2017)]